MLEKSDFRNQRPALDEGRSAAPSAKAVAKAVVGGSSPPAISLWMVQMVGSGNPPYLLVDGSDGGFAPTLRLLARFVVVVMPKRRTKKLRKGP